MAQKERCATVYDKLVVLEYGGGGHEAAGTCQIANDQADSVLRILVQRINADG